MTVCPEKRSSLNNFSAPAEPILSFADHALVKQRFVSHIRETLLLAAKK